MWLRLCVDVDMSGNVTGWSAERHDDWGRKQGVMCGTPGPFDTRHEALDYATPAEVEAAYYQSQNAAPALT